jgi:tetratricopeptide (TPR) repeat protein
MRYDYIINFAQTFLSIDLVYRHLVQKAMSTTGYAYALYNQSLELWERIGNVQGKAATLHQLAILYADKGEVDEAIALLQCTRR